MGLSVLCSRAKVPAVAPRPLSAKAQVRSQSTPCVICVVKVKITKGFLRVLLRFHTTLLRSVFHIHNSRSFDSTPLNSGIRIALSVATGWTVRGSNPRGGKIFRTGPDRPWGPPSLLYLD